MSKLVNYTLVAVAALLFCAYIEARATPTISYLDDIKLSWRRQDDTWLCDFLTCPNTTVGCRILRYNDANRTNVLWRINHCYNSRNFNIMTFQYEQRVTVAPKIDININSFHGAVTELIYGYSNTSQTVNGTVRWDNWPNVQQQYRGIITEVDAQNRTSIN